MTEIKMEDILLVEIGSGCLQSLPCQHGVRLTMKSGNVHIISHVSGVDCVRLLTVVKGRKLGCPLTHFHYLTKYESHMNCMNKSHKEQRPIKCSGVRVECELTYPRDYKPKEIKIRAPKTKVPKASKAQLYLRERGIHVFSGVTMAQAKQLAGAIGKM